MEVGGVEFKVTLDWSEFNRDIRNVETQFKKSGEQVNCIPAKLCTDQLEKQLQQIYARKFEPVNVPVNFTASNASVSQLQNISANATVVASTTIEDNADGIINEIKNASSMQLKENKISANSLGQIEKNTRKNIFSLLLSSAVSGAASGIAQDFIQKKSNQSAAKSGNDYMAELVSDLIVVVEKTVDDAAQKIVQTLDFQSSLFLSDKSISQKAIEPGTKIDLPADFVQAAKEMVKELVLSQPVPALNEKQIQPDFTAKERPKDSPDDIKFAAIEAWKSIINEIPSQDFYTKGLVENLDSILQKLPSQQSAIAEYAIPQLAELRKTYLGKTDWQKEYNLPSMQSMSQKSMKGLEPAQIKVATQEMQKFYLAVLQTQKTVNQMKQSLPKGANTGIVSDLSGQVNLLATQAKKKILSVLGNDAGNELLKSVGENLVLNIKSGVSQQITSDSSSMHQHGLQLAEGIAEGAREGLGIHSPSDVFIEIGEMVTEGFTIGINHFSKSTELILSSFQNLWADVFSLTQSASQQLTKIFVNLSNQTTSVISDIFNVVPQIAQNLQKNISNIADIVKESVEKINPNLASTVMSQVSSTVSSAVNSAFMELDLAKIKLQVQVEASLSDFKQQIASQLSAIQSLTVELLPLEQLAKTKSVLLKTAKEIRQEIIPDEELKQVQEFFQKFQEEIVSEVLQEFFPESGMTAEDLGPLLDGIKQNIQEIFQEEVDSITQAISTQFQDMKMMIEISKINIELKKDEILSKIKSVQDSISWSIQEKISQSKIIQGIVHQVKTAQLQVEKFKSKVLSYSEEIKSKVLSYGEKIKSKVLSYSENKIQELVPGINFKKGFSASNVNLIAKSLKEKIESFPNSLKTKIDIVLSRIAEKTKEITSITTEKFSEVFNKILVKANIAATTIKNNFTDSFTKIRKVAALVVSSMFPSIQVSESDFGSLKTLIPILSQIKTLSVEIGKQTFVNIKNLFTASSFTAAIAILNFTNLLFVIKTIPKIVGSISKAIEATKELREAFSTITFLTGSFGAGKNIQKWVEQTSLASGASLQSLAQGYAQLSASIAGTQMSQSDVKNIISSMSKASLAYGLDKEKLQGATLALSQMAGKGVVSMEELRGQLAERLPGAFGIAARAMNLTQSEMTKLVSSGKLLAADFLPRFGNQLKKEMSAIEGIADPLVVAEAKLNSTTESLQKRIADIGVPFKLFFVQMQQNLLSILGKLPIIPTLLVPVVFAVKTMATYLSWLGKILASSKIFLSNLVSIFASKETFSVAIKALGASVKSFGLLALSQITAIGLAITSLALLGQLASALKDLGLVFASMFQMAVVDTETWANSTEKSVKKISEAFKDVEQRQEVIQKRQGQNVFENVLYASDKTSRQESLGSQAVKTGVSGLGVGLIGTTILAGLQALLWKAGVIQAASLSAAIAPLIPYLMPLLLAGVIAVGINKMVNWLRTGNSNLVTIKDLLDERRIFGTEKMAAAAGQLSDRTLTVVQDYKLGKGAMREVEAIDKKLATLSQQRMTAIMEGNQQAVGEIDRSVQKLQTERQEIGAGVFALQDTIAAEIEKYRRNIESESNDAVRESLQIILADLERSNKLLTKYQFESGAIDAVKKFALAVRLLQADLEAAAQSAQRLLSAQGKDIATVQGQEFNTNRFAASEAQLKSQQAQLDAVRREAETRAFLLQTHQKTISLLPEYGAAMAYAEKHAQGLGRELETADFKYLAEQAKNLGQLGFERVFNEVASTRDEIQKTAEMEKQMAEQTTQMLYAQQQAQLEQFQELMADKQAVLQQGEAKSLTVIKKAQMDMRMSESQAAIKTAEIQEQTAKQNLSLTRQQRQSIEQMHRDGIIGAEEFTRRMRDLKTEELRGEQSLMEQKLAVRQAINAKILEDSERARQQAQTGVELEMSQLQTQQVQSQIDLAGQIGGEGSDKVASFQNNLLQSLQTTKQLGLYQQQYQENIELASKKVIAQRELETRQMELQKQMATSRQELLKQELELKKQILTQTEMENRLSDSRRNTMQAQLQTMQSQNQLMQSQLSNQSTVSTEIGNAVGMQDNAAFIQMKADNEQAMASAKVKAAQQEFEEQRKILDLERQKEESIARQAVIIAKRVLDEAMATGNKSAIKVAEQQLAIAEAEMESVKQISAEQKKNLDIQLRNTVATAQNELALSRIRSAMEKIQAEGNRRLKQLDNEKSLMDAQLRLIQAQSRLAQEQIQARLKLNQLMAGENKTALNSSIIAQFENQAAQQKVSAAKAEYNANLANLKIEQERELITANIAIAKAKAALEEAKTTGNNQLIQAAQENLALEQKQVAMLQQRHKIQIAATKTEGNATMLQAEQEAILTRIQKKLEIIKAAGEERIKGLEREKSLLDAQLRVVQSQSQFGQFGTQSLLDIAGGFNFEESLRGVKARGMVEQALSSQKLSDMAKEQAMARRGLEIDLAREETRARTNVLVAREALLQAQMLGDQSAIKIAREQLDISNRELSHQMEIAGLQREGLANEQKLATLQIQKEQSAARYKQSLDEVRVITKNLETSLSNQQRSLTSIKDLASARGELSAAVSAGEIAQIDRAIELRRRLKDEGLSRGEKAAYQNQLAQTGYMQSEISLLQQKFNLEQKAAQDKWKQLQAEQAIERQLLIIDQQRNMIASKQALAEARIAAIKAQQEQMAARASGDTGRMQLADELVAATQAQIGLLSQNAGLTTFLDQQALQALDYRQRAADVGFRNEQDAARNRFADEMIAAQKTNNGSGGGSGSIGSIGSRWTDGGSRWTDGGSRWTDGGSRWTDGGSRWTDGGSRWTDSIPTAGWAEKNFKDGAIAPEVDKIVSSVSSFDASINRLILAFEEKEKQVNRPNKFIFPSISGQPKKATAQSTFVAPNQITINVSEATNSPRETGTQVRSEVLKALDDVFTKLKTQQQQP